ncbi:MAG: FMN-binding negative transcriptional regulator [Actinomycetes bacterium]
MYIPHHFKEERDEQILSFVRHFPLATLITHDQTGITANLIPFIIKRGKDPQSLSLSGHLARGNNQLRDLALGNECLLVFQGPQDYVTPGWYETKKENGKVVPTWNYTTVHIWGTPLVHDDATWLRNHVGELTDTHEAQQSTPWKVEDAPEEFISKSLSAIVGLSIESVRIEGKMKISQNRSEDDRNGVISGMGTANPELATFMQKYFRKN